MTLIKPTDFDIITVTACAASKNQGKKYDVSEKAIGKRSFGL